LSIKDNIGMVKEELNSEEKFFEKAVLTERFVKKYKKLLISSLVVAVVGVSANLVYDAKEESRVDSANKALSVLMKDAKNTKALDDLKSQSPNLYDVWILSNAVVDGDNKAMKELQNSKANLVADIASYELAQNLQDLKAFDEYTLKQGAIYRDLALVQSAVILMDNGDIKSAHQKLSQISVNSPLSKVANALLHYGVK